MTTLYCLGDSLTFGPGVKPLEKWTALCTAAGLHTVNLGVSGDTTAGMLVRLQSLLAQKPPAVLLLGGSNDIFFTGSDLCARNNMAAMVHQLLAAGCGVYVALPLPVVVEDAPQKWAALTDFAAANRCLQAYCQWLRAFCHALQVPVVDFQKYYVNQDGTVRRALYLDGLHPNAQGHRVLADTLLEAVQ